MIPDTKPDADGMYWKNGKIYSKAPWWWYPVMIPAMAGTLAIVAWALIVAAIKLSSLL